VWGVNGAVRQGGLWAWCGRCSCPHDHGALLRLLTSAELVDLLHNPSRYAYRLWAGLLSGYYAPRWTSFVTALSTAVRHGVPFDQRAFDAALVPWELQWIANGNVTSASVGTDPVGDTVAVAAMLSAKWSPDVQHCTHRW
jgi:hypothetical protein